MLLLLAVVALLVAATVASRIVISRIRPVRSYTALDDYGLLRTLVLVDTLDTVLVFPDEYDQARRMVSWVL
jgi:hypothetical protein